MTMQTKATTAEGAGTRERRLRGDERGQARRRRWPQCGGGDGDAVTVFLSRGKIENWKNNSSSNSAKASEKNRVFRVGFGTIRGTIWRYYYHKIVPK
jgi:hypothetical protein